jgi:hypothetical protein
MTRRDKIKTGAMLTIVVSALLVGLVVLHELIELITK